MDLNRQKLITRLTAKGRKETDRPTSSVDRRTALAGLLTMGAAGSAKEAMAQAQGKVWAYTDKDSYLPGETVKLHASGENYTQYPVNVQWQLMSSKSGAIVTSGPLAVQAMYPRVESLNQNWPVAVQITIPANLESGFYYLTFTGSTFSAAGFVVRETSTKRAEILIVLPTFTYAAYNNFGGKSTYNFNSSNSVPAVTVSLNRPGGIVLLDNDNMNAMSKWLCANYDCSFASDFDLHANPSLLTGKKCVVLLDHNEYYTEQIRRNLQRYLGQGGNIANLGGNSCWWFIEYEPVNRTIKHDKNDPLRWYWHKLGNSAKTLIGCAFEHGGFNGLGLPHLDATIYKAEHWLFNGSTAQNGQVFGNALKMANYEVDGIDVEWVRSPAGGYVPRPRAGSGTPPSFEVLALADLTNLNWSKPGGAGSNWAIGMYHTEWKGRVFNGGTIQWGYAFVPDSSGVLADNAPIHLTRNFLNACVAGAVLYEHSASYPNSSLAPRDAQLKRYLYTTSPTAPAGWTATSSGVVLCKSTDTDAVPVYRHFTNNLIPNTKVRVMLDSMSTEPVRAGLTPAGSVGFAFKTQKLKTRPVHVYFTQLPEGRVERLSVRQVAKAGETYGGIRFYVY